MNKEEIMGEEEVGKEDASRDKDFESKISIWKSMNERTAEEINRASKLLDDEMLEHPVIDLSRSSLLVEDNRKRCINKDEDRKKAKVFWTNEDQESNGENGASSFVGEVESNVNNQGLDEDCDKLYDEACEMGITNPNDLKLGEDEGRKCGNTGTTSELKRTSTPLDHRFEDRTVKESLFNEINLNSKGAGLADVSILDKPIVNFDEVNNNLNTENSLLRELFKNEFPEGRNNTPDGKKAVNNMLGDPNCRIPVFREGVMNYIDGTFANPNASNSKTAEIHSSKYMNGTIPIDASAEVISHLESKISVLSAQLESYKRMVGEKDGIIKNLRNSMELLFDELKNDNIQENICIQASEGLAIIKELRKIETPADKTQENGKLKIENMSLKNIIDELVLKIKVLKDRPH